MLRERLLQEYEVYPFRSHPYWREVADGALSRPQAIGAERQHVLQVAAISRLGARSYLGVSSPDAFNMFLDEYMATQLSRPPHELLSAMLPDVEDPPTPTSATSASIALCEFVRARGFEVYAVAFGLLAEHRAEMYSDAHRAYRRVFRFSESQLEFYRSASEAERAKTSKVEALLQQAVGRHGEDVLRVAVREAVTSTNLALDGMRQSANGSREYWGGL